ncbi:hypothetical protein [Rhodoplanes elegans]|nr:hypothetical protein [Rhodoplanes elegans]
MIWMFAAVSIYLMIGCMVAVLISRSSCPHGAAWSVILWPLWLFPRSS